VSDDAGTEICEGRRHGARERERLTSASKLPSLSPTLDTEMMAEFGDPEDHRVSSAVNESSCARVGPPPSIHSFLLRLAGERYTISARERVRTWTGFRIDRY